VWADHLAKNDHCTPTRAVRLARCPVAIGMAVGVPIAVVIGRAAEGLLFGVTSADPASYLIGAAALTLAATAAAWLPARRACSVDPAEGLRRA
jgi:putative ABC transport system permease protein